jgi:hypothetical protein
LPSYSVLGLNNSDDAYAQGAASRADIVDPQTQEVLRLVVSWPGNRGFVRT